MFFFQFNLASHSCKKSSNKTSNELFLNRQNLILWCHHIPIEKGETPKGIHSDMAAKLGVVHRALSTIQLWVAEFLSEKEIV